MCLLFANIRVMAEQALDTLPNFSDTTPVPQIDTTITLPSAADTPVVGIASYYADRFEGRKTSSGEIFRQSKMTAAHNILPLGTWIRVTRLDNGNQVLVKINDRMHPLNPRLVDLSKTAARKLGYIKMGIVMVRIEQLGMHPPPDQ